MTDDELLARLTALETKCFVLKGEIDGAAIVIDAIAAVTLLLSREPFDRAMEAIDDTVLSLEERHLAAEPGVQIRYAAARRVLDRTIARMRDARIRTDGGKAGLE